MVLTGKGGVNSPPPPLGIWVTHPPTHIRKFVLWEKLELIKGPEISGRF